MGFGIWGLGVEVLGCRFGVCGVWSTVAWPCSFPGREHPYPACWVLGLKCRVSGAGYMVRGAGARGWGLGLKF